MNGFYCLEHIMLMKPPKIVEGMQFSTTQIFHFNHHLAREKKSHIKSVHRALICFIKVQMCVFVFYAPVICKETFLNK